MYAVCEPIVDQFMVNLWSSYGQIVNAPTFVPPPFRKNQRGKIFGCCQAEKFKIAQVQQVP